jgi:hypothetical protein
VEAGVRNGGEGSNDLHEEIVDNVNDDDQEMEDQTENLETNEKVDLYDDEGDRRSDSSLSMTTKVKNVEEGKSPNFGKKKHKEVGILEEIEEANGNIFSNRLAPKSDVPIMDRAKKISMQKNLQSSQGSDNTLPTLANTSDYGILDIASKVGIDLGTTLDVIETNLVLIREQEQARVNIFLSRDDPGKEEYPVDMDNQPDAVDQVLLDILKLGKEDCEVMTDKLVTACANKKGKGLGERWLLWSFTVKPPSRLR